MLNRIRTSDKSILALILITAVLMTPLFFSCKTKSQGTSIISILDEVDIYISQGQIQDALKSLKKAQKFSKSEDAILGIYRRYIKLGEKDIAFKLISKGLKNNSSSIKIRAVLVSHLLDNGKTAEALKVSKPLSNTDYGSLYAQAFLENEIKTSNGASIDFTDSKYENIYLDAYKGTKNNEWLRNVVTLSFINGKIDDLLLLCPTEFQGIQDAYFWGLTCYDASYYAQSVTALEAAKDYFHTYDVKNNQSISLIEIISLLSDAYISLGEEEKAEAERKVLFDAIGLTGDLYDDKASDTTLSILYLNSAMWAFNKADYFAAHKYLSFEVENWPSYVPALIAYGNYAYESSTWKLENPYVEELRNAGLKTIEMEEFDDLPRIPVLDALARMEDCLSEKSNPTLYIAKLDLENRISSGTEKQARISKIYAMLEENASGVNEYPREIMRYAIYALLKENEIEDAGSLFYRYIKTLYHFSDKEDFWVQAISSLRIMDLWEVEYLAWFAANYRMTDEALRLYEYSVFESSNENTEKLSPKASAVSAINLAMIYSSTNQKQKAIELYGKAMGRASSVYDKAEIMYRLACLYSSSGETSYALDSLKYCLALNPSHSYARLMYYELTQEQ